MNFQMAGQLLVCSGCDRKILIERALIGVSHTATTIATCWDCLGLESQEKAKTMYKLEETVS